MPEKYHKALAAFKTLKFSKESGYEQSLDSVTVEEPLEIKISWDGREPEVVSIIMRTPSYDKYLAIGFLYSEGIIKDISEVLEVKSIDPDGTADGNVVIVKVSDTVSFDKSGYTRNFTVNSSCGVCGKSNINDIFIKSGKLVKGGVRIGTSILLSLPDKMRKLQKIFSETGGIHAAGLFYNDGTPVFVAEDIGRHNAVDKIVGYMLLNDLTFKDNLVLQVSGRAGFEILQKAAMAGIPVVSSVSAPSSLAVETADSMNMTLVCFVRGNRLNVYTHPERIEQEPPNTA